MKKVLWIFIVAVFCFFGAGSVSAITYQGEVNVRFTFNDVLSLTVDDELIDVGTLLPGSSAVSDPITLTVNTNYLYGYKLLATVGDTTHDYRELKREDGEQSFVSLAVDSDVATLPDGDSVWGYAKSVDGGTTWSNYSGLPKYDSNAKLLNSSTGAAMNATTNFRVGAKVKGTQAPGTYSNVVNFVLLTNPSKIYLQDITSADCTSEEMTVYDRRDETEYTIGRVNGVCWLLDNMSLDLVATSLEQLQGNTNASDTTLNYLKNGGGTTSDQYATAGVTNWTSDYSFSAPLIYTASKDTTGTGGYAAGKYGVYYNYCAASAGSYCYGDGTTAGTPSGNATEDICPKGWRMPTGASSVDDSSGEYGAAAFNSDYTGFVDALRTPLAGYSNNGSVFDQNSNSTFWSSTRYIDGISSSLYMGALFVDASDVDPQSYEERSCGSLVRCVLNES